MTEAKTVQKMVRAITVQCAAEGCSAKSEAAASSTGEGDDEIIAPRGWTFGERHPRSTPDVILGSCPAHSKR